MYLLTVSERIKYFLRGRNIPLAEADRLMGNYVGFLKKTKNPGADYVSTFCDTFPEVSAEWLIRGSGKMLIDESPSGSGVPTPTEPASLVSDSEPILSTIMHQLSTINSQLVEQQVLINNQSDLIRQQEELIREQTKLIEQLQRAHKEAHPIAPTA